MTDQTWTMPPDCFHRNASKAIRALSTIVVRPKYSCMFSDTRGGGGFSFVPPTEPPIGMRAYRSLHWAKMISRPEIDVRGRDSYRFQIRSCPGKDAAYKADAEYMASLVEKCQKAQRKSTVRRETGCPHQRSKSVTIIGSESGNKPESKPPEASTLRPVPRPVGRSSIDKKSILEQRGSIDRRGSVNIQEEPEHSNKAEDRAMHTILNHKADILSETSLGGGGARIRGLSPSEETLIVLQCYERKLVREAWEATLPQKDTTTEEVMRRAAVSTELEKDRWTLREKEIEAINRARLLSSERDRNRRAACFESVHQELIIAHQKSRKNQLQQQLAKLRKHRQRALQYLEKCVVNCWTPAPYELQHKKKPDPPELCLYFTKWSPAKLKKLHSDLKVIRKKSQRNTCKFVPKIWKEGPEVETDAYGSDAHLLIVPDEEFKAYAGAFRLQRLLRGRAAQSLWYEGKRLNSDLIRELLSSKPFDTGECKGDALSEGLAASTGWTRLKTYDEYAMKPIQEKWVLELLDNLPPPLEIYNLADFVNVICMKIRGRSGSSTRTSQQNSQPRSGRSNTGGCVSTPASTLMRKHGPTPSRRPVSDEKRQSSDTDSCYSTFRARSRHKRNAPLQTIPTSTLETDAVQPRDTSSYAEVTRSIPGSESLARSGSIPGMNVANITTTEHTDTDTTVPTIAIATDFVSNSKVDPPEQTTNSLMTSESTAEIRGQSGSQGLRGSIWATRSPPLDYSVSESIATVVSRLTMEDMTDRRDDELLPPGANRSSAPLNVSASASEETPSSDDTHIIADDATELAAAAFRAKVREHGKQLAAQRIDEAPSPSSSGTSSSVFRHVLGRSVSQQHAPPTFASSASSDRVRLKKNDQVESEATLATRSSLSDWTLDEAARQQIQMRKYARDSNRKIELNSARTSTCQTAKQPEPQPTRTPPKESLSEHDTK